MFVTQKQLDTERDARIKAEARTESLESQMTAEREAHREEVTRLLQHLAPIAQLTPAGQSASGMTLEEELEFAKLRPAAGRTQIDDKRAEIRRLSQLILKQPTNSDNGASLSAEEERRLSERLNY